MECHEIAIRVEKLERENRRLKLAGTVIVVLLLAIHLVVAQRSGQVVEAQRILLVDDSGRVGVEIDAYSITLTGEDDSEGNRFGSSLQPHGLNVRYGNGGETLAVLEVNTREFDLIDYVRERRAVVTPAVLGLQNGIVGMSEAPTAWVATMRESGFEFQDHEGRTRAKMGRLGPAVPAGVGATAYRAAVVLYDDEENVTWKAPQ